MHFSTCLTHKVSQISMGSSAILEKTAHGEKEYNLIPLLPVSINISEHLSGSNFL